MITACSWGPRWLCGRGGRLGCLPPYKPFLRVYVARCFHTTSTWLQGLLLLTCLCWSPLWPPQLVLFYDGTSPSSYASALTEVEAVEKSTSEEFDFLKCDISKTENMKEAVKVCVCACGEAVRTPVPPVPPVEVQEHRRVWSWVQRCTCVRLAVYPGVCVHWCVFWGTADENGQPTLRVCEDGGHWHRCVY